MRLLFIGDIFGHAGRRIVADHVADIRKTEAIDVVIANGENSAAGFGITPAVAKLRQTYAEDCPPIEVECRTLAEVDEAVAAQVSRIMLDNMDLDLLREALARVPQGIETEASGNVTLDNIAAIGAAGPDFVSVGRITHSAPAADLSMRIQPLE